MKEKESNLALPEIEIRKNLGLRVVLKGVSLTFLIVIVLISVSLIVLFTVEMDKTIDAGGTLEPVKRFYMHSPESGIFLSFFHSAGDTVKKGDLVAQLDSTDIWEHLQQLRNEYLSKENDLEKLLASNEFEQKQNVILTEKTEAQLLRAKASFRERLLDFYPGQDPDSILHHYKPGTHITLDYGKAEVLTAEAERENRKLQNEYFKNKQYDVIDLKLSLSYLSQQITELERKLNNLKIKSPADGIILTEDLDKLVGKFITKGELLVEMYQQQNWKVVLNLAENDIHKIKIGNEVKVEVLPLNENDEREIYHAKVFSFSLQPVSNSATELRSSKNYRVTAIIDEKDKIIPLEKFRTDFTVEGRIIVDHGLIGELLFKYFEDLL